MTKLSHEECARRVARRAALIAKIKEQYPEKNGAVLFFGSFERQRETFYQDSTFTYYVGIDAPGVVVYQELDGEAVLYEPQFSTNPDIWVSKPYTEKLLQHVGITTKVPLGSAVCGYSLSVFSSTQITHKNVLEACQALVANGRYIFVVIEDASDDARMLIDRIFKATDFVSKIVDISAISATLRRKKDNQELEAMYKAIEVTLIAQEAVAGAIRPGTRESDAHAAVQYIFAESSMVPAYTPIIGSGKNSTVLHYTANDAPFCQGDVVVVDVGASYKHYCADITRTYPVSGVFTQRQKEVYDIVLKTQEYIAGLAKPGMWLNNIDERAHSLHHLAYDFLEQQGYAKYFPHGIGHFVGLDVHDVGDRKVALEAGDIITIEPGIYIPEERLGIRIEDMYWIVDGEAICLSEGFAKTTTEIEEMMRQSEIKEHVQEASKFDQNLFLS